MDGAKEMKRSEDEPPRMTLRVSNLDEANGHRTSFIQRSIELPVRYTGFVLLHYA